MDNPNNPNPSNNPNQAPTPSDLGNFPSSTPTPTPPTQPEPTTFPSTPPPPTPTWPSEPIQPPPAPTPPPTSTWTPPAQPIPTSPMAGPEPMSAEVWPAAPQSSTNIVAPIAQPEPIPAQPEPAPIQSEPASTFTPPLPTPPPSGIEPAAPESSLSPLDNPWGVPTQTPPIEQPPAATQPSWMNVPEAAPTDLSHLISNNQPEPAASPTPETLVTPSAVTPAPEVSTLSTETHRGIPKWLIGLGIGLLILVAGASAYFILGIGQPTKTTSLPATTVVKSPAPVATPTVQPNSATATGSANFGQLQGGSNQPATSSSIELIRQRNQ